jgi:hypothetical protein
MLHIIVGNGNENHIFSAEYKSVVSSFHPFFFSFHFLKLFFGQEKEVTFENKEYSAPTFKKENP